MAAAFEEDDWRARLSQRERQVLDLAEFRSSAVMMLLFERAGAWHLLFTKRSEEVSSHKGQICFPGGRQEATDESLLATALRECEEEIGLPRDSVRVLGPLDDLTTLKDYRITPYLGVIPDGLSFKTDPNEVEAVLEFPVAAFLAPENLRVEHLRHPDGVKRAVYFYTVGETVVWGATARIVKGWLDLVAEAYRTDAAGLMRVFAPNGL